MKKNTWDKDKVFRTTKCFGARNRRSPYNGSFPAGFLKWVQKNGWWGNKRCYLCSGPIDDKEAIRVDIRPDTKPTHLEDARKTSLSDKTFDWIMIDPPYTKMLAKELYDTEKYFAGIDAFTKEASRLCKPRGLILTLTYAIPKRIKDCDFIAVCGIYQIPMVAYMRCFTVSRKK